MRLFPNFIVENQRISKPEDFDRFPRVTSYTPASLQIEAEYQNWMAFKFLFFFPEPEILTGSIEIRNLKEIPFNLTLQLGLKLVPMGKGQPSHPDKSGNNQFLTGKTDRLEPVLFMTGGPSAISSPFPALSIHLEIQPERAQEISWALVSKNTRSHSFEEAKKTISSDWRDALRSHEMQFAGRTIGIKTGNPDWDAAFLLSQVNVKTHLLKYDREPEKPHFIKIRMPDQSSISDIRETKSNILTNLEFNHLCQVLLPTEVDLVKHILEKQIASQIENLRKDVNDGHSNHNSLLSECPLLSSILLDIYEITQDTGILVQHYPNLDLLFKSWVINHFSNSLNEHLYWENPGLLQIDTGLYAFDVWESYGKGLDISKVESPSLYAMLFTEAKALYKISKLLGDRSQLRFFNHWQKECQKRLDTCWRDHLNLYGYQDIETHLHPSVESFYRGFIEDKIEFNQILDKPQRLQCHIYTSDEYTRACTITIEGKSCQGEPIQEVFKPQGILWVMGRAHLTTKYLFTELNTVSIEGLDLQDRIVIETADYTQCDITCLLPLWSGAGKKVHLEEISSEVLDPQNEKLAFGIPETWECEHPLPESLPTRVNVLWNTLILEGLTKQNESVKAEILFTKLMGTIIGGLKDYGGFFPLFDSKTGQPVGQYNDITGLIPIQLFLKIAGIKLLSSTKVALWDTNPFPWPVEVHWKGLSLWKEGSLTKITFPNGLTAENDTNKSVLITCKSK